MSNAFENLLISSPNGGGLLFVHKGQVFRLDDINTTGISLRGDKFLRGLQPDGLIFYQGNQTTHDPRTPIYDIHDVLIEAPALYAVGTTANEVLQLDMNAVHQRSWSFPGEDDARHINCLALWNQRIVFCAFGDFTHHRQYKGNTSQAGFVQDLHSGERLIEGLSQPHSLVPFGDNLLLANSESRELHEYDRNAQLLRSKTLDGYTRGICVQGDTLYIGLSRSRNIDNSAIVNANLVALNAKTWEELGRITLPTSEIYSVLAIDDTDALPSVLAGISQRAAVDYRSAINARDEQIQELENNCERLRQMCASLEEHLGTRNQQFTVHVEAISGRDARIGELAQENAALLQKLEQYEAFNAENGLKLALSQSHIDTLEVELEKQLQHSEQLLRQTEQIAEQLHEALTDQIREQQIQSLSAAGAEKEKRIAELVAQDQLTRQQLDQTIERCLTKKQQLTHLASVIQEKDDQLEATRVLLNGVTQTKNEQLETARLLLAERDLQLAIMSQKLEENEQATRLMLDSHSWRLMRPFRDLRRALRI